MLRMRFEKDIFISYAHIDNESMVDGDKGWITEFHRSLEIRLAQLLGQKPVIWRDQKLQGNDVFGDEIVDQFENVAIFISIISPRYVKSEWCTKEVIEFKKASERNMGLRHKNKSRIFKLIKTPVHFEDHPEEMKDLLGYEFYKIDPGTGRAKELGRMYGPESERDYWIKLDDVAHDIVDLLNSIKESESTTPIEKKDKIGSDISVYLAETSYDLKELREDIKRDLIEHDFHIYPDRPLSLIAPELNEQVSEMLSESKLSIHLIGNSYGIVPEGTEKSKIVLQNEVAAEQSKEKGLKRLIWLPQNISTDDTRQELFIESLKTNSNLQKGAEIFKTPLEELKFAIFDRLKEKPAIEQVQSEAEGFEKIKEIYLICDQKDLEYVPDIEDYLYDQGFNVTLPVFEGDESQVRLDHQENLLNTDAVIIFYGLGNELWMRSKVRELMKIAGYGRKKPLVNKAVLIADPPAVYKDRFRAHGIVVLSGKEGLPEEGLQSLVEKIKNSK
jgi:hypothetical protein